jgi:[protein-PII] uridylyltransferase
LPPLVGDETHLDYLYLLTVADVRGTNPKLWNSWKAQLFEELYAARPNGPCGAGWKTRSTATNWLPNAGQPRASLPASSRYPAARLDAIWAELGEEYFLRYHPEEIAWHTRLLAAREGGRPSAFWSASRTRPHAPAHR